MNNNLKLAGGQTTEFGNPILGETLKNLLSDNGVGNSTAFLNIFLPNTIGLLFVIGVIIFLFMIILGAIGWISSGGDKAALEGARGKISNAIIGIVILLSTFALFSLIETFFGINILTIDIGPLIIQ